MDCDFGESFCPHGTGSAEGARYTCMYIQSLRQKDREQKRNPRDSGYEIQHFPEQFRRRIFCAYRTGVGQAPVFFFRHMCIRIILLSCFLI